MNKRTTLGNAIRRFTLATLTSIAFIAAILAISIGSLAALVVSRK